MIREEKEKIIKELLDSDPEGTTSIVLKYFRGYLERVMDNPEILLVDHDNFEKRFEFHEEEMNRIMVDLGELTHHLNTYLFGEYSGRTLENHRYSGNGGNLEDRLNNLESLVTGRLNYLESEIDRIKGGLL